jgi:hypothetical protein
MELPKLVHPSTCLLSGPTGSGKTVFVKKLIDFKMFNPMPTQIIYCYGSYQPLFNSMKSVTFEEGLPSNLSSLQNALIIIDDLMAELASDSRLSNLFTKGSHHRKLSVIFITQNFFHQGKEMRNIHLNSHYIILYKNPRDKSQITHLARQMFPGKVKAFQEIFQDATAPSFGYLLIDLRPETEERLRLRTGIFPSDKHYVYEPR